MADYDKQPNDLKAIPSHVDATVEHDATPEKPDTSRLALTDTNEHNLSFRDVARKHPKIIW